MTINSFKRMEESTFQTIDQKVKQAAQAYQFLKQTHIKDRAAFMNAVADKIEAMGQELLETAHTETSLPMGRLTGEKGRTIGQWRSYAKAVAAGMYVEARIDLPQKETPKSDLRKYNIGIGPVAVFGASNFPFAFSTAGGDTASAIGAGCPVIVKGHPGHPKTSQLMAEVILQAVKDFGWPEGIFGHVTGRSHDIGAYLTKHELVKAVAFTGSFAGGKALFDLANQREVPIPVFAEMGSVNPIFALPFQLNLRAEELAKEYAASLTLGVGQFCTNPGLFIARDSDDMARFKEALSEEIAQVTPANMLNKGIFENFEKHKQEACTQAGVSTLIEVKSEANQWQGRAIIAETTGENFLQNKILLEEVFGPYGLLVKCQSKEEMAKVASHLKGQLTVTLAATEVDIRAHKDMIEILKDKCGRLLFNGMPTGVEVVYGMHHGGPFPSTTDARFTSVGPDAVKRFLRPISFQNWPNEFLPDELKNENPIQINRVVDGELHDRAL